MRMPLWPGMRVSSPDAENLQAVLFYSYNHKLQVEGRLNVLGRIGSNATIAVSWRAGVLIRQECQESPRV
jgi:hypothetical protein